LKDLQSAPEIAATMFRQQEFHRNLTILELHFACCGLLDSFFNGQ